MQFLENLKPWLGRKSVQGAILVTFILIMGVVVSTGDKEETMAVELNKSVVSLTTSSEFAGGQSLSLIGSVRAFTEAKITSEKSGRVTGVNVNLGQQVSAGTILMTLENASERASVLQAEGVYEAAQAAAAQTNFGTSEAETRLFNARLSAINTVRSAYTTANSVVVSNIDNYFSNPNSTIPGLRVGGQGRTPDLNNERVAYQDLLPEWNRRVDSVTPDEPDLLEMLSYSRANVQRTIAFLDIFLFVFDQKEMKIMRLMS